MCKSYDHMTCVLYMMSHANHMTCPMQSVVHSLGVVENAEFDGRVERDGEAGITTVLDGHHSLVLQEMEVVNVSGRYHKSNTNTNTEVTC